MSEKRVLDRAVLKCETANGIPLEATFLPGQGMSLISYKLGDIEVLDQSTKKPFETHSAGLGPMIGPHFHLRKAETIPPVKNESLFPNIQSNKDNGEPDPFTHGIGRYAPWNAEITGNQIHATLTGDDLWHDTPLKELEGQNFKMQFDVELTPEGLKLDLSVISDTDSVVGIHYYYHLPNGKGRIVSHVQNNYIPKLEVAPIPDSWNLDAQNKLTYELNQDTDFTFYPFPNPLNGKITLETETHDLITSYSSLSQENSWQLWHPKGASFVCIEPLSAQDPRRPNLSVSEINIHLEIKEKQLVDTT